MAKGRLSAGEIAAALFWGSIGIALLLTYWYVGVAILGAGIVIYFATRKGRIERRTREREARRFAVYSYGREASVRNGREYVIMLSRAMELLAAGEAPTFAMLQRQLQVSRATADWLMMDLERLSMVSGNVHGKRRSTVASAEVLTDSAWVLRTSA